MDIYRTNQKSNKLSTTPWGQLPTGLRLLLINGSTSDVSWLGSVLQSDGTVAIEVVQAKGALEGMTSLRNDTFDAVLMTEDAKIEVSEMVAGIQGASSQSPPILLLGQRAQADQQAMAFENGLDGYVCLASTSIRSLVWVIATAVERNKLLTENTRLLKKYVQQQENWKNNAQAQVTELRDLIRSWAGDEDALPASVASLQSRLGPTALDSYRDLLRTYVIVGSGSIASEVKQFCRIFRQAALCPAEVVAVHLSVLEEMVEQLGVKSSRHVVNRANLMLVQLLICLSEPTVSTDDNVPDVSGEVTDLDNWEPPADASFAGERPRHAGWAARGRGIPVDLGNG